LSVRLIKLSTPKYDPLVGHMRKPRMKTSLQHAQVDNVLSHYRALYSQVDLNQEWMYAYIYLFITLTLYFVRRVDVFVSYSTCLSIFLEWLMLNISFKHFFFMINVDFSRRRRLHRRAVGRTLIVVRNLRHQMDCPMNVNLQLLFQLYV
jgi:hypothetical protein